jgi:hypothetical protein
MDMIPRQLDIANGEDCHAHRKCSLQAHDQIESVESVAAFEGAKQLQMMLNHSEFGWTHPKVLFGPGMQM